MNRHGVIRAMERPVTYLQLAATTAGVIATIAIAMLTGAFSWDRRLDRAEDRLNDIETRVSSVKLPELTERITRIEDDVRWIRHDLERRH